MRTTYEALSYTYNHDQFPYVIMHESPTPVEPDARRYTCEGCGQPKVYGLEELVLMGIAIIEPDR
jgi:hypothetical protein